MIVLLFSDISSEPESETQDDSPLWPYFYYGGSNSENQEVSFKYVDWYLVNMIWEIPWPKSYGIERFVKPHKSRTKTTRLSAALLILLTAIFFETGPLSNQMKSQNPTIIGQMGLPRQTLAD